MNKSDFLANLIEYSQKERFSFLTSDGIIQDPKQLSKGQQMVVDGILGAALGVLGVMVGGYSESRKIELIKDLQAMSAHGDLVGIDISAGMVLLRIAIDADYLSDDTLVGRFTLIHERAHDFRKYAPSNISGSMSTQAQVVLIFSSHERAANFSTKYAKKCKQRSLWKKVVTNPWIADLEREEIERFGFFTSIGLANLQKGLFHHRA